MPLFAEYQVNGGGRAAEGARPIEEKVVAATVVFGRSIDGINVVGPGSKAAVVFANDGEVVGFDYDWAPYRRTGRRQTVMSAAEVRQRARGLTAVDLASSSVNLRRVECGYFDGGVRRPDAAAAIQAACGFEYVDTRTVDAELHRRDPKSGQTVAAFFETIPAGRTVEPDRGWSQAARLSGVAPRTSAAPPAAE